MQESKQEAIKFWSLQKVAKNPISSHLKDPVIFIITNQNKCSGPSCSKLMTSLVNDLLQFTSNDTQIC